MMCRNYHVFTILYRYDHHPFKTGESRREERTVTIVAPSRELAWAYIEQDQRRNNPEFVQVVACDIDAIVEIHAS